MATLGAGFGQFARAHHATLPTYHANHSLQQMRMMARNLPRQQRTQRVSFPRSRPFSSSSGKRPRFSQRLGEAWNNSKITWYQIPVGVGIGFLGLIQFYKVSAREKERQRQEEEGPLPKKRPRVQLEGPWQVQIMSTLPLKAISRLWGRFNELTIPYYLRVPGFKLYSYIFGVK